MFINYRIIFRIGIYKLLFLGPCGALVLGSSGYSAGRVPTIAAAAGIFCLLVSVVFFLAFCARNIIYIYIYF